MIYQEYIDLEFERHDMSDQVLFKQIGYSGFYLTKRINKKLSVSVYHDELDKPRLYVEGEDKSPFVVLNTEMVKMIFKKKHEVSHYSSMA